MMDVQISINTIRETEFILSNIPDANAVPELGKDLNIGVGFKFSANVEDGKFYFQTLINYTLLKSTEPFLKLETEIVFDIINISSVVKIEGKNQIKVDDIFLATLAGVCIGTSRGMLVHRISGTSIENLHIPILNPTDILNQMKTKS